MFEGINRIIFDLDNVIIKHEDEKDAMCICDRLNIKYSEEFRKQLLVMFQSLAGFVKNKKVTRNLIASGAEKYMPILSKYNKTGMDIVTAISNKGSDISMENAKELLDYLQEKGYFIVALTNWFLVDQIAILKRLNLFDYFERIFSWDDYYAKPDRFAFEKALESASPSRCVMIGDDLIGDIIPAQKLGIRTIGFNINYTKMGSKKVFEKPDVDVQNLLEIKKFL